MLLWRLLVAFTRANLLGYGGGPAVIPLVKAEVVGTYHWMTDSEFGDALAIGNTLPGPIATKMAAYIGYRVGGVPGALASLIGTVVPTAIIMIILAGFLWRHKDSPVVKGMIKGAKPVVFVMFILLAIDFLPFVRPDKAGWIPAVMAAAAFAAIYFFKVQQPVVIAVALAFGALLLR